MSWGCSMSLKQQANFTKPLGMDFFRNKRIVDDKSQAHQSEDESKSQQLVKKSGFVSLKDRLENLVEHTRKRGELDRSPGNEGRDERRENSKQFATLQELFSSRSGSQQKSYCSSRGNNCQQQPKKPKIPIMKLSKEDWNVKCWEDRLCSYKRRQECARAMGSKPSIENSLSRQAKRRPAEQVEVFRGRIEEVATKLERVCEGAPADEKLYELTMNKGLRGELRGAGSHEWTDLLKSELMKGTHNPKQLKAELATVGAHLSPSGPVQIKSPLGRPIRRLFQDDDDDEEEDERGNRNEEQSQIGGVL